MYPNNSAIILLTAPYWHGILNVSRAVSRGAGAGREDAKVTRTGPGTFSLTRSNLLMAKASVASAQTATNNWMTAMRSGQTQQKYTAGITNCPVNPMAQAATPEAQQSYQNGTAMAVSSGKMAAALNATPKSAWVTGATTKGAANLAIGANNAQQKVSSSMNKLAASWQAMNQAAKGVTGPKGYATGAAKWQAAMAAQQQALGKS